MIIFNQHEQYENLIKNGFEKYPNSRDLVIIGKEWIFKQQISRDEIREKLISFCKEKCEFFNEAKSINLIDIVIKKLYEATTYSIIPEEITFFEEEIKEILELNNEKEEKLLFIILFLSKLRMSNGIYINSQSSMSLKEIFSLTGVKLKTCERKALLRSLILKKKVELDLKPLLRVRVPFIQTEGTPKITAKPSSEIIKEFEKCLGARFIKCEVCGKLVELKSRACNSRKYCPECSKKIRNEKQRLLMASRKLKNNS